MSYKETTLDNGLRIVAECSPSAATSAIGFFVKTGSRDETPSLMGVSHFLEHMMFKGTNTRSAEEVDLAFDSLGAEHNAFTSGEMTAFWGAGMPEVICDINDILMDILQPALREQDFESEKKVILEEIAMYADQPFWVLYEHALEKYYENQSLGNRVLGTVETIESMTRDELALYFQNRYSSSNTTVALAGRVNFDLIVDQISSQCGDWKNTRASRIYPEIHRTTGKTELRIDDLTQHYIIMMMPGTQFSSEQKYASIALGSILGGGEGSRFHWALVDKGLADSAATSVHVHDGYGEQIAWATCDPKNAEEVESIMQTEMMRIVDSLEQKDLDRVIAKVATGTAIRGERPAGNMRRLGSMLTQGGRYMSLADELLEIESLKITDLKSIAEEFPWQPMFIASTVH